jgi:hypothetical protein
MNDGNESGKDGGLVCTGIVWEGSERKSRLHETIAFESTCSLRKWSERSVGGGKGEARERKDGKERK